MDHDRKLFLRGAAGLVLAAGIGLAVATGSGTTPAGYGAGTSTTGAATAAATVRTADTGLGQILVDGRNRTLYLFEANRPASPHATTPAPVYGPH
jgi:predicted lipoprotein with Yx(FWY)xxD motif